VNTTFNSVILKLGHPMIHLLFLATLMNILAVPLAVAISIIFPIDPLCYFSNEQLGKHFSPATQQSVFIDKVSSQ
jgi:hypothetical protein